MLEESYVHMCMPRLDAWENLVQTWTCPGAEACFTRPSTVHCRLDRPLPHPDGLCHWRFANVSAHPQWQCYPFLDILPTEWLSSAYFSLCRRHPKDDLKHTSMCPLSEAPHWTDSAIHTIASLSGPLCLAVQEVWADATETVVQPC